MNSKIEEKFEEVFHLQFDIMCDLILFTVWYYLWFNIVDEFDIICSLILSADLILSQTVSCWCLLHSEASMSSEDSNQEK